MVPIAAFPPFTLCTHPPIFLYSVSYITTTSDHLPATPSTVLDFTYGCVILMHVLYLYIMGKEKSFAPHVALIRH
jgi:hypothetical protein